MKWKSRTTYTTVLEGSVSRDELLAWINNQAPIPKGAHVRLYVGDDPLDLDVNLGNPLRITITTSGEVVAPGELTTGQG